MNSVVKHHPPTARREISHLWYGGRWSADLRAWTVLCVVWGAVMIVYLSMGLKASEGSLVMPLDDTYIHFQYARQMANGEPYVYNPGDDPTSGATSFLYTPLLAAGYLLGFQGLKLAYWAVGLGSLFFLLSAWLIYKIVLPARPRRSDYAIAGMLMLAFVVSGPIVWAALSGMETLLFLVAVMGVLYVGSPLLTSPKHGRGTCSLVFGIARPEQRCIYVTLLAGVAALARPEGAVVAVTVVAALAWNERRIRWWMVLPLLASGMQPLVNWMVTGDMTASGNLAKSHLYNVTIPLSERIEISLEFWGRMWRELVSGRNPADGRYVPSMLVILALAAVLMGARDSWRRREVMPELLAGCWLLVMSGAIATLDTAFWHFKRYQLPLMALIFPLAGWLLVRIRAQRWRWLSVGVASGILVLSSWTTLEYARRYHDNIAVVRHQQIAMARWIDAELPENARIGVHDVGVVRYVGNRATYDVVGLTSADVALAWRQGSGVIYDTMTNHPNRPDYFAVYHDIQSLPLLEQAGVFGEELARFTFPLPENTVASATSTQIVSVANWPTEDFMREPQLSVVGFAEPLAVLNVGNIASERDFNYEWWNDEPVAGFVSVVRSLPYATCDREPCAGIDGGRIINGGEAFDLPVLDEQSHYLIVLRVHAENAARLLVGCDSVEAVQVVPNRPGEWMDVPFLLSAAESRFCLEAEGTYQPSAYWIYGGNFEPVPAPDDVAMVFHDPFEGHEVQLVAADYQLADDTVIITVTWYSAGDGERDGKIFVHVYDDPTQPPVRQVDTWPGGGMLPPGNWLPGMVQDQVVLDLEGLPEGQYSLAIGIYEPNSQTRYTGDSGDRLFLGEIEVD